MPPSAVKSIKDLLYWQYAKIISNAVGYGKENYGFIMNCFKKLQQGEMTWSSSIREYVKEREKAGECIYCGKKEEALTLEHILPRSCDGPDCPDNAVWVCKSCNSTKGGKRLYEWQGLKLKDKHTRIAEGKYLKLLYNLHDKGGTLELTDVGKLCPQCKLSSKCAKKEKLTVYCLEGIF